MPASPPLYVHKDGVPRTLPAPTWRRAAVLMALGMGSVIAGTLSAAALLTANDAAARGLALPLFLVSAAFTGSFLAHREASEPARNVARTARFLNEETTHDR